MFRVRGGLHELPPALRRGGGRALAVLVLPPQEPRRLLLVLGAVQGQGAPLRAEAFAYGEP